MIGSLCTGYGGLDMAAQLRILGNGVRPPQAVIGIEEAWRNLVCHVD